MKYYYAQGELNILCTASIFEAISKFNGLLDLNNSCHSIKFSQKVYKSNMMWDTYKLDFGSSNDLCISRTMGVKPVPAANMTRF